MPAKLNGPTEQIGKGAIAPPRPSRVEPVSVGELATLADALLTTPGRADVVVTGATLRAQHVRRGDLFAALPGARVHGADFAGDALAAGAAAILTDEAGARRPAIRDAEEVRDGQVPVLIHRDPRAVVGELAARIYGNPSRHLDVWGVTGTSGKTTTTYLIESALAADGHDTGLIGTVETRIAGQRLDSAFTTPEAPDLQALLAVMLERGVTAVVMEVSSHALALGRVAGTHFAVGAFTNLSQDHLDFHQDMEDYFQTKAALFDGRADVEVVCVDSEWGRRLVKPTTVTVATVPPGQDDADEPGPTWVAEDVVVSPTGEQTFTAVNAAAGLSLPIGIALPGSFNVANALLAVGCLHAMEVGPDAIVRGLAAARVPGRMERVDAGQDFTAVVDYSHKPAAVAVALDAVRARATGRVIVALGCGGDRDTAKRPIMGEAAARRSDLLVVTDDNPRSEDPAAIRQAMLAGALAVPETERGEVIEVGDRRQAIRRAVAEAGPGDVVVIAGKGHETGQEVAGVVHPFSDRDELAAAIRATLGADNPGANGSNANGGDASGSNEETP
ncbi:UDP-N-acetylmuramoyl-L-alanyl-D-glutamate--2,6-diaminopimelate ligase [Goodfellowiella coeruleoviolacea]|uniref:UDP-N-acetylmuramoyl-L-alanyl-D-glutamate--2,6-diaminopimelate ligase n=1 Tax=Goodfellowiella coeruleoviolacea TaxID=334858 RepID=A0AAE3GLE0_9PSEU|nr:UDP-N-acetylmuramoyl-L-alanyl-D-glutamate--2,6-diaminopimelate ligase [Goodfellowiella coeruleoviolacea]MCP2169544.1 UDP-N-acetylmuramoylalanyl-D-glutamate--2,6-diaminopimelate ligase [Goodfellowiella coeruleoviolacea]